MKKQLLYFSLFFVQFINAQNVFQDDLSSYTVNIDLSSQGTWTNNSSLPGGAGTASASGPGATKVIDSPISYPSYGSSSKSRDIKINSDACGTAFTPITSGDVFIGFVLNLSSTQANNNSDFFRVLSGGNFFTTFRLYAIPSGSGFSLGIAKGANGNPISFTTNTYNLNQDHLIIFKYTIGSNASDDVLNLYVDSTFQNGLPTTPDATTSSGTDQVAAVGIDRLIFRNNWTNGMPTGKSGLFSVSNSWSTLAFPNLTNDQFTISNFIITSQEVSNGILTVNSEQQLDNATLSIYDLQGRKIESKIVSLTVNKNTISVQPILNSGIYIVEIVNNNKQFTQKIIVN